MNSTLPETLVTEPFHGAKLAILVGDGIVTILRDEIPGIPWPGYWDLPGGGREGEETPEACVLRELKEELGIVLTSQDLIWSQNNVSSPSTVWLFVAECPSFDETAVLFGNEGQKWKIAKIDWFMTNKKVIYYHQDRLISYLSTRDAKFF